MDVLSSSHLQVWREPSTNACAICGSMRPNDSEDRYASACSGESSIPSSSWW